MVGAALVNTGGGGASTGRHRQDSCVYLSGGGVAPWAAFCGMALAVMWLFRRATPARAQQYFRRGQLFSRPPCFSLGHGGNDAQKTMGIIFVH